MRRNKTTSRPNNLIFFFFFLLINFLHVYLNFNMLHIKIHVLQMVNIINKLPTESYTTMHNKKLSKKERKVNNHYAW